MIKENILDREWSAGAAGTSSLPSGDSPSTKTEIAARVRRGRQDDTCTAKFLQFCTTSCAVASIVMMRAELSRQRLFVIASIDRDCFKPICRAY